MEKQREEKFREQAKEKYWQEINISASESMEIFENWKLTKKQKEKLRKHFLELAVRYWTLGVVNKHNYRLCGEAREERDRFTADFREVRSEYLRSLLPFDKSLNDKPKSVRMSKYTPYKYHLAEWWYTCHN